MDLSIDGHACREDGSQVLELRGIHAEVPIGLNVVVLPEWKPDILGDQIPVFWGRVAYETIGAESDQLLAVLAQGYHRPQSSAGMAPRIEFTAIALRGDPSKLSTEAIKMKLFFEPENVMQYAEVYTNLDVPNRIGQIHEKDFGYRKSLLAALEQPRRA